MLIQEIIHAIQPLQVVNPNVDLQEWNIVHLLTDSRQLGTEPSNTLFFALQTSKDDGANYIPLLIERGVKTFALTQVQYDSLPMASKQSSAIFLVVASVLSALQNLAAYKRSLYHCPVIGITGSNGKTVVKEWLYQLLKDDYCITRSPKSYNSQIGVPLSVWQMNEYTELAIFEAGISEVGEMERLQPIIQPTIGVLTYIGPEHGENFSSLDVKRQEKMKLFASASVVVEDATHQNIRTCACVMRALGYDEETITERILHQTHETVLQINLSAMVDNVRYFRSLLRPETNLIAMVKAFAYGAGSVEVSRALQECGMIDYLAVAVADEGVELRRAGITLPIVVMDPEVAALDLIMENNLQPNIYSFQSLQEFMIAAQCKGLENYPIHIKIDSGMHRLGFYKEEMEALIDLLSNQNTLRIQSVFSHLAGSDEQQFDDFTLQQIHYFDACAEIIQHNIAYPIMKHICNSAGIERFSKYQYDMCRLGIGLYGFSFVGAPLRNVCSLRTTILSIKTVPAHDTIGYGRHTTLTEPRQIAVIPIGYADGFDRRLSNYVGEVIVRGSRCPVIGNVCMDQAMIDVTGTDAQVGDAVEIFGDRLPVEEIAQKLGTITYEILTSVSRRVQRIYIHE